MRTHEQQRTDEQDTMQTSIIIKQGQAVHRSEAFDKFNLNKKENFKSKRQTNLLTIKHAANRQKDE